jgi:intracellular multiplication protein IcmJ
MTDLYPIKLAATTEGWRLFSIRNSDPGFSSFRERVFKRDNYVCRYCGFQAKKYQEVVNIDGNYRNNKISNLVTACCFCTQCFFLEVVGKGDYGGGSLIYLPEMSQVDLNALCHVLFCAMYNATSYSGDSRNIYRGLKLRKNVVEKKLGEGIGDPALLGRAIIDSPEGDSKKIIEEILPSLRLLPFYAKFENQVRAWSENIEEDLSAS